MNKSEISAKIKNAIENKLCSLDSYVDKELPEYILVMIANKKSKEAMSNDLQLFLGQKTNVFTEWLHDYLEKLQKNSDDSLRNKTEKVLKVKTTCDIPDKKSKKNDKEKQKIKSKNKKKDDKKNHKKSNISKTNRSRSRSPSKSEMCKSNETKVPKTIVSPEKTINHNHDNVVRESFLNSKSEKECSSQQEPKLEINTEIVETINKSGNVEPKTVTSVVSVVKVSEKPSTRKEIIFPSIEMVQRDLKQAEADIANKADINLTDKQAQRSSVFTRLGGMNDLRRAKLNKVEKDKKCEETVTGSPLKRTINKIQSAIDQDIDSRESKIKRLETGTVSPNFIVTLKGAEKLNIPLTSRLGPKRKQDNIITTTISSTVETDLINEEEDYIEETTNEMTLDNVNAQDTKENQDTVVTEIQQQSKCRFWPTCKNKEVCPYVHPTEPCKTFPNCKFGTLCLYIHPTCRFSASCSKPDCPFTHYGPKLVPNLTKPATMLSLQRCLYYPNCTNVGCKYFHPNLPCKFGLSCKLKDSCMFYHPSIPKMTELKWVANSQETQNVIDVTSSKKSEIQTV